MAKYELTITPDYVPDWTLTDAVRELFQNAIDQETIRDNTMFYDYDEEAQTFSIGNRFSVLEINSLLLGSTTKADDEGAIGQFGEGYKIASLVLTRLGKPIVFYNYGAREVWRPRFVKSRRYKSDILTFFVDRKYVWQSAPNNNLTIVIENITPEDMELIKNSYLGMQSNSHGIGATQGMVLFDEEQKGRIYVNGLYVKTHEGLHYGYNFLPKYLKLDRDRKLVTDFDLQWLTSQTWADISSFAPRRVHELLEKSAPDVQYLRSQYSPRSEGLVQVAAVAHESFVAEHGPTAVPISSQAEMESIPEGRKPVIVPSALAEVIKQSAEYEEPELVERKTLKDKVSEWLWQHELDMNPKAAEELRTILEEEEE